MVLHRWACHLLGYLDGEEQGVAGLEAALESVLSAPGAQDEIRCQVDARGGCWKILSRSVAAPKAGRGSG